jgi:hypothetical protein
MNRQLPAYLTLWWLILLIICQRIRPPALYHLGYAFVVLTPGDQSITQSEPPECEISAPGFVSEHFPRQKVENDRGRGLRRLGRQPVRAFLQNN